MRVAILGGHYLKNLCLADEVWSWPLPLTINPGADNSVQRLLAEQCPFTPDLLFVGDQGCVPMITGLEDLKIPTAAYLIDTHLSYEWHRYFAGVFDMVFVAQHNAAQGLKTYFSHCQWLPLFSRDGDLKRNIDKTTDVVFVGTVNEKRNPERVKFLRAFAQEMPLEIRSGDYREPFNRSRIVLNQSVRNDVNFRVFEALATGSMLLTDAVGNGLDELFADGQHLVMYRQGDVDDAIAKARYYLAHPGERERIAAAGYAQVLEKHTLGARCTQILSQLEILPYQYHEVSTHVAATRRYTKKLAAGRTYLGIALLMADLQHLHGNDGHGRLADWYLQLAEAVFSQVLTMELANDEIVKDLALLSYLQRGLQKAATYNKMAVLDKPFDVEQLLLGSRIAAQRGDGHTARNLYNKAAGMVQELLQVSEDQLWCEHLVAQAAFCRNYL